MSRLKRFEQELLSTMEELTGPPCPPILAKAMRHAVFAGGSRLRPRVLMAVAESCGAVDECVCMHAAVAVELLHCASLVHDDLPSFDDAAVRRGKPSVHAAFGEATAVLVGDALLVGAFQALYQLADEHSQRAMKLIGMLAKAAGPPEGIIAGQAWEQEKDVNVQAYHRSKTATLFEMSAMAGAVCGGGEPREFRAVGEWVGRAYQIADDLRDQLGNSEDMGKPAGKDQQLSRPSMVTERGVDKSIELFDEALSSAVKSVPMCSNPESLRTFIKDLLERFRVGVDKGNELRGNE